jgi:hydroxyacyl-ACP dehydratase HTD2-like protein with hotdog domain
VTAQSSVPSVEKRPSDLTWTGRPDAVDLFLFSAAVGLAHRIHYDVEFARGEGLDGVPVHGPLQAAYLSQLVSRWARESGGRLSAMKVRHRRPVLAGQTVVCRATQTDVEDAEGFARGRWLLELSVDGEVCTEGTAETVIPRSTGPAEDGT